MKTDINLTPKWHLFLFSVNNSFAAPILSHAKTDISAISVNLARKPEGVGVRGQGKVAFSYALRREASAVHGFPFPGIIAPQILICEAESMKKRPAVQTAGLLECGMFPGCARWVRSTSGLQHQRVAARKGLQRARFTVRRRRLSGRRRGWSLPTGRRGPRGPCGRTRRPACRWDGAGRGRR